MNIYRKYLKDKIKELEALSDIKSVAWHMKEDDRPEWCWLAVRVEDVSGQVVEIVRHNLSSLQGFEDVEEVLINLIIAKCQISGTWIGVTCNLNEAVEALRKAFPYVGIQFVNETDMMVKCGWKEAEYIW